MTGITLKSSIMPVAVTKESFINLVNTVISNGGIKTVGRLVCSDLVT